MTNTSISAAQFAQHYARDPGPVLLDVRTPAEFGELHVRGARNVPLDQLAPGLLPAVPEGQPLFVICRSGSRGKLASQKLAGWGVANVVNVEGGTLACEQAGLPLVRGAKAMSLERQVRIAAGSLVLAGLALGWWVHPILLLLAAFVGAGLVFSGVTDTCGMALLLARMPWNRACGQAACDAGQLPQSSA